MDRWLFYSQNLWAGWGYPSDYVAWFLAVWGTGVLALLLLLRWHYPGPDPRRGRRTVLLAIGVVIFTVGIAHLPDSVIYRERPFVRLRGAFDLLDAQTATSSFPSEHAAGAFALAIVLGWESRRWGLLSWPVALGIAWARVYAGVHYPSDMLGALVLSSITAAFFLALRPDLEPALDWLLSLLSETGEEVESE